jgi:hypothetical protein
MQVKIILNIVKSGVTNNPQNRSLCLILLVQEIGTILVAFANIKFEWWEYQKGKNEINLSCKTWN